VGTGSSLQLDLGQLEKLNRITIRVIKITLITGIMILWGQGCSSKRELKFEWPGEKCSACTVSVTCSNIPLTHQLEKEFKPLL
jgi:hypothetical protein